MGVFSSSSRSFRLCGQKYRRFFCFGGFARGFSLDDVSLSTSMSSSVSPDDASFDWGSVVAESFDSADSPFPSSGETLFSPVDCVIFDSSVPCALSFAAVDGEDSFLVSDGTVGAAVVGALSGTFPFARGCGE
jgi:hypothetical protein